MKTYRITLIPREDVAFEVRPNETILEAAERCGVAMIAGCRTGSCLTCAARLESGRVTVPAGTALTKRLADAQVVLPCVSTCHADSVLRVGPPGQTLLHPRMIRPWTD